MSKIAIVTGAGTGVGQVVAKKLSEDEMKVMLVGRRLEKLEETKAICADNVEILRVFLPSPPVPQTSIQSKSLKSMRMQSSKSASRKPFSSCS